MSHPKDNKILDVSVLARSRELLDFKYLDQWSRRLDLTAELNYLLGE